MKKTTKRILCSALSLCMAGTLALEYGLRPSAETLNVSTSSQNVSIENVTGAYDTTALRSAYFNNSVTKASDVAPVYETRRVIVELDGDAVFDYANGTSVPHYVKSWSGQRAAEKITTEQDAFLSALKKKGISYQLKRRYDTLLNGVSIEIDTKYVSAIKKMDGVKSVVIANSYAEPETVETKSTTVVENKTNVYETGIYDAGEYASYGEGSVVAVLDTGLDYTHPAFQGFMSDDVKVAWDEAYIENVIKTKTLTAETRSGSLTAAQVYISEKVPFAYDYADDDPDVYPSYSNHGTHVAGIVGGYDRNGYTDKDGNPITDKEFKGVVPDAQLAIFKVFTDDLDDPDIGGAVTDDIVAALEDCVTLGVDVINMSLGTSCGFTTTNDGDDEGELLNAVYESIQQSGITLSAAASNDYSAGYGGAFGTNLASNPDSSTVGSPSTFAASFSVASINGQKADYFVANANDEDDKTFVFYEEARDIDSNPFDFGEEMLAKDASGEFEYVVVPGTGERKDYSKAIKDLLKAKPRLVLVKCGDSTFEDKVKVAREFGAAGIIVYNNVAGIIRMNLGEIEDERIPAVSINMNAGNALRKAAVNRIGTIKISKDYKAGPFMSEFSSWGPTHDLTLKPEITAHGGEITSAVPGGYGEQSGTSMAAPNMAGFMAIARNYIKERFNTNDPREINRLAMQLTMSTAGTAYDQDNLPYSPRKQGAGVAKIENVVNGTNAYLFTENAANDNRPKVELGDDPTKSGEYTVTFKIKNFGTTTLQFSTDSVIMTETLAADGIAVSEQAYLLNDKAAIWTMDGADVDGTISVGAGEVKEISVHFSLSQDEKDYIDKSFKNGMYVEGFVKLLSETDNQCDLSIPFLGFYGDWSAAPMLDYSAYEVAASEKDASVKEEDKLKASVWGTQPFSMYYNEKYVLPMGGYLYLLDEDDEPVYADEARCAISRYNEYYGEENAENYLTSTGIKAVYAGLLRNARIVKYKMYNVETGEMIISDGVINRVGKAYSGGGQAVPANVELELSPEDYNLVANGQYRMEFEFYMTKEDAEQPCAEENTFEFSFTVDYDAPVLEQARIRYYNYKDGNKEKQRIYLDVDIYDNHYAQAMMLCYPTKNAQGETVLQLATEYPTPIRDGKKNGTTTVTVEITDIYQELCEKYGNQLYLQIDDYALNSCLYRVQLGDANGVSTPQGDQYELADGENAISLDIYETHKVSLNYGANFQGETNLSNFLWMSQNPAIANVKNGEIVGISEGTTTVFISNRKGDVKSIEVTVSNTVSKKLPSVPTISFGAIKGAEDWLQQAAGNVEVVAGKSFTLQVNTDPWYHPMDKLILKWESSNPAVATVDQNGNVQTLKKGTATIKAIVYKQLANGKEEGTTTLASVTLRVRNEFTVSNYALSDYNGVGYNGEICENCGMAWAYDELVTDGSDTDTTKDNCPDCGAIVSGGKTVLKIPSDMNIWYIGENAFKDNDNVQRIVIPESVQDIQEQAFLNCTALEEVYFVSTKQEAIPNADVKMIYQRAFMNCTALKKVDFSNVKTVTLSDDCFAGCISLEEVVDMPAVGTMHHRAFMGCTSLEEVDISGLHMSGQQVFAGCISLTNIKTGKFTAIGDSMFEGCTSLREKVVLSTPKIGNYAFKDCVNLSGVSFKSPEGETLKFDIGAGAFENCGSNLTGNFTAEFNGEIIRTIGEKAFANASLKEVGEINGLESIGGNVFIGTYVKKFTLTDTMDLTAMRLSGVPFAGIELIVADGSTKYTMKNGVLYNQDKTAALFINPSVSGELNLPASVKEIGAYAFANSNVTKVTLVNVEKIGEYAFSGSKLQTIIFGNSEISELAEGTFYNSALQAIELPNSVKTIGVRALSNTALTSFKGDGVTEIKNYAFAGCSILQTITLADGVKKMGNSVFADCISLKTVVLPSVEELGSYTFRGASNLETVTFGANATVTGTYTFASTPVKSVTLGKLVTEIGDGVFADTRRLETVTLPDDVTKIGRSAFEGATSLKEVEGIENVTVFGDYAFYNTALTSLTLTSAETIGYAAFGAEREAKYTAISIPNVKTLGDYAFLNGGENKVTLPASVTKIGVGAFASSKVLTEIEVAEENEVFFVDDGILYRYIDKAANTYEIVCYPTAKMSEGGSYVIKDGTVSVKAYAFYELNENALEKVTLPYSINTIGDGAFYRSGVKEYTFESIQAPTLETLHNQEITDRIEQMATELTAAYYRGYYYSNFDGLFVDYTQYGKKTNEYIMNYPENGIGYDNHVYKTYFGVRKSLGIRIEDATRQFVDWINSDKTPTPANVAEWMNLPITDENKAMVAAFAEEVKTYRLYYNNVNKNAAQAQFVTQEQTDKLLGIETQMRNVKARFGIVSKISDLKLAPTSAHKNVYKIGSTFDMTGLVMTVVYDDYSTETVDANKLTLETTEELTAYDRYVMVSYEGKSAQVLITVNETGTLEEDNSSSDTETVVPQTNLTWLWIVIGVVALGGAAAAVWFFVLKQQWPFGKKETEVVDGETAETETQEEVETQAQEGAEVVDETVVEDAIEEVMESPVEDDTTDGANE
ncbi:MAG: leucine-rich repeat protein [Clostridia bacterium]|nr:leucine-rich repeat protein [Clostridia bacterium]